MARAFMETPVSGPNSELDRGVYQLLGDLKYRMINFTGVALAVGNAAVVDFSKGSLGATVNADGAVTDFLRRMVKPATPTTTSGMLGVVVDLLGGDGADGEELVFQFRGKCTVWAYGTSGVDAGKELKINVGEITMDGNTGSANKTYAYTLSGTTAGADSEENAQLVDIMLIGPWGGGI